MSVISRQATGIPCRALGGGTKKTLCLSRRGRQQLQEESPCWQHLLDLLFSVPFPGDFCETVDEFTALLQKDHQQSLLDNLLSEDGELWAGEWDETRKATLQLRCFSVARYSKPAAGVNMPQGEVTLSAFETLHRRQEWLMRFYIDGAVPVRRYHRELAILYGAVCITAQQITWPDVHAQ